MKRSLWQSRPVALTVLSLSALVLSGCGSDNEISRNLQNVLPNTARSILAARAYDRFKVAAQHQDQHGADVAIRDYAQFERDQADLRRLAEWFVNQGLEYDSQAMQQQEGTPVKADLLRQSAEAYRRAMTFSGGKFDSEDYQLLNALGYFLADRGTTPADFREAERLIRLSLAKYVDAQSPTASAAYLANYNAASRANIRDSLAWSLYRQGKYDAAEREQMAALKTWRTAMRAINASNNDIEADYTYHLASIYAARNQTHLARGAFQRSLQLRPLFPAAQRGLAALEPSVQT